MRIAVMGAGTMGNGIAHVFAQWGHEVTLVDVAAEPLERARATIAKNLERQVRKGALTEADRDATLARIRMATERTAAAGAALVVEAVPEDLQLKADLL